ncbi:MAG: LysR substrate-binding domain-containing protein [Pseudomonadota bacterium]
MKLQQLRFLLAVADSGCNVTEAANRLHTSQPGVSKQIKLLEEELGAPLFERKGRALTGLTDIGDTVVAHARVVMREIESIRAAGNRQYPQERPVLSIATTQTQARYVLPPILREFSLQYPDVQLDLHQGTSEQIAELVRKRSVDFALASGAEQLFADLKRVPCFQWDRVVIVPRDHPLTARTEPLTLATLAEHPLVTYVFSAGRSSSLLRAFSSQGLDPEIAFTARDADVIKTYVRIGMGVGVVASMAYACDDRDDLVAIDATGLFPRLTTWLGFREDLHLTAYMQDFLGRMAADMTPATIQAVARASSQADIDSIVEGVEPPLVAGCYGDERNFPAQ